MCLNPLTAALSHLSLLRSLLLYFFLVDLPSGDSGVLNSSTTIMFLSLFLLCLWTKSLKNFTDPTFGMQMLSRMFCLQVRLYGSTLWDSTTMAC